MSAGIFMLLFHWLEYQADWLNSLFIRRTFELKTSQSVAHSSCIMRLQIQKYKSSK